MWDGVAAAGISAGASAIGSLFNMGAQRRENRRNREWQTRENQLQRDWSQRMTENQNKYNDPTEQMRRLKEAGVNPHLAYANGAPMNVQTAPAQASTHAIPPGQAEKFDTQGMLNAMMIGAQIDNIKADTANKLADANVKDTTNEKLKTELEVWAEKVNVDIEVQKTNVAVNNSKLEVNAQQVAESVQKVANMASENENIKQQLENLKSQKDLTDEQIKTTIKALGVMDAQIENYRASAMQSRASANLSNETAKNQSFIRSNLAVQTLTQNEVLKSHSRANYIGDKFDINKAEHDFKYNNAQMELIKHRVIGEAKNNLLKDVNISSGELNNIINSITAPAKVLNEYRGGRGTTETVTETMKDKHGTSTNSKTRRR